MKVKAAKLAIFFMVWSAGAVSAFAADLPEYEAKLRQKEEAIVMLQRDNALLQEKVKLFECSPIISRDDLARKNLLRLQEIAHDVKGQRQAMADFEGYVKWMSADLSRYSKYIEAGSAAAAFARFLPIPYAGQAGLFTKFVSHFAMSLNAASVSIDRYMKTSQQYIARVGAIDPAKPLNQKEIAELGRFADEQLLREMNDAQAKLVTTSDLSASTLSFLEGMHQYIGSTDEYWNKTKSLLTKKDADKKDKSFLVESINGLKGRAELFNAKLKLFDETARKDAPLIKSVVAYEELIREIEVKVAKNTKL